MKKKRKNDSLSIIPTPSPDAGSSKAASRLSRPLQTVHLDSVPWNTKKGNEKRLLSEKVS